MRLRGTLRVCPGAIVPRLPKLTNAPVTFNAIVAVSMPSADARKTVSPSTRPATVNSAVLSPASTVTVAGVTDAPVTGKKGHGPFPVDTAAGKVSHDGFAALVIEVGSVVLLLRQGPYAIAVHSAALGVSIAFHSGFIGLSPRRSISIRHLSGTVFTLDPPSIRPTLIVGGPRSGSDRLPRNSSANRSMSVNTLPMR